MNVVREHCRTPTIFYIWKLKIPTVVDQMKVKEKYPNTNVEYEDIVKPETWNAYLDITET